MSCEPFAQGDSPFHSADPRGKLLAAMVFSVAVAVLDTIPCAAAALAVGVGLAAAARLPLRPLVHRLLQVNLFIAMLWMVVPLWPPRTLEIMGFLWVNQTAFPRLLLITLKCNAIVLAVISLLSTSTLFALTHAMAHLAVPSKLVQLFFFSWRYIHLLEEEWGRMSRAARLRGFKPRTNLHTYRTYAALLGSLLVKSYDRGERVYWAMRLRGFESTFWLLDHFHFSPRDGLLAVLPMAVAVILLALDGMAG